MGTFVRSRSGAGEGDWGGEGLTDTTRHEPRGIFLGEIYSTKGLEREDMGKTYFSSDSRRSLRDNICLLCRLWIMWLLYLWIAKGPQGGGPEEKLPFIGFDWVE